MKFPGAAATPLPVPISSSPFLPVKQSTGQTSVQQLQGQQDTAGSEGQININTASMKVISAIPFFTPDIDPYYMADNVTMGYYTAAWRDWPASNTATPHAGYGPYRSIFDIMKVQQVINNQAVPLFLVYHQIWATAGDPSKQGQFTSLSWPGEASNEAGNFSTV